MSDSAETKHITLTREFLAANPRESPTKVAHDVSLDKKTSGPIRKETGPLAPMTKQLNSEKNVEPWKLALTHQEKELEKLTRQLNETTKLVMNQSSKIQELELFRQKVLQFFLQTDKVDHTIQDLREQVQVLHSQQQTLEKNCQKILQGLKQPVNPIQIQSRLTDPHPIPQSQLTLSSAFPLEDILASLPPFHSTMEEEKQDHSESRSSLGTTRLSLVKSQSNVGTTQLGMAKSRPSLGITQLQQDYNLRRWTNTEMRLCLLEECELGRQDRNLHHMYADLLDSEGFHFPTTLAKRANRGQSWNQEWSRYNELNGTRLLTTGLDSSPFLAPVPVFSVDPPIASAETKTHSVGARSRDPNNDPISSSWTPTKDPAPSLSIPTSSPPQHPDSSQDHPESLLWHYPLASEEHLDPIQHTIVPLETTPLRAKILYGLFIKLRHVDSISTQTPVRPGGLPKQDDLEPYLANMAQDNPVILLEWQTNRAKKLNGVSKFKFTEIPVIQETNLDPKVKTTNICFLLEREPIRLIQDRVPTRLMQFDTTFGPTKKRILKVSHITLDNRRKYQIICPEGFWPVYEIWEMNGPRPDQDRHLLVYRSSESPPSQPSVPNMPPVQEVEDGSEEEETEVKTMLGANLGAMVKPDSTSPLNSPLLSAPPAAVKVSSSSSSSFSSSSSSSTVFVPGSTSVAVPQTVPAMPTDPVPTPNTPFSSLPSPTLPTSNQDAAVLTDFAIYWQGEAQMGIVREQDKFVCTVELTVWLPSLVPLPVGESPHVTAHVIPVCHAHSNDRSSVLGAQHAALLRIRRDYHPYWMMFVLQQVPLCEALWQFWKFFVPEFQPSWIQDKMVHRYEESNQRNTWSIQYGSSRKDVAMVENKDDNTAREEASAIALKELQKSFPNHYLISCPMDDRQAMSTYVQIHSAFPGEKLLENKSGSLHQWTFRGMVLAEGNTRTISTGRILLSIRLVSSSGIQKHLVMTENFSNALGLSPTDSNLSHSGSGPSLLKEPPSLSAPTSSSSLVASSSPTIASFAPSTTRSTPTVPSFSLSISKPAPTSSLTPSTTKPSTISPFSPSVTKPVSTSFLTPSTANSTTRSPFASSVSKPAVSSSLALSTTNPIDTSFLSSAVSQPAVPFPRSPSITKPLDTPSLSSSATKPLGTPLPKDEQKIPHKNDVQMPMIVKNSNVLSKYPEKLTSQSAMEFFQDLKLIPFRSENETLSSLVKLKQWARDVIKFGPEEVEHMFQVTSQNNLFTCQVQLRGEPLGTETGRTKEEAVEKTADVVWKTIRYHEDYKHSFLIEVPDPSVTDPTRELLEFLRRSCAQCQDDDLQGNYRSFMNTAPHGTTLPVFECMLIYQNICVRAGRGDTKRRARDEASRKFLLLISEAVKLLTSDQLKTLVDQFADKMVKSA